MSNFCFPIKIHCSLNLLRQHNCLPTMRLLLSICTIAVVTSSAPRRMPHQRTDNSRNCVSKFYNRELGPLEILMLPLGEKLWVRAWLGNHMTNLLHMEPIDLAEVTQIGSGSKRRRRSLVDKDENQNILPMHVVPNSYHLMLQPMPQESLFQGRVQINVTCLEGTNKIVLHAHKELQVSRTAVSVRRLGRILPEQRNRFDSFPQNYLQIIKVERDMRTSQCEILLSEPLVKGGTYHLDIQFSGQLIRNKQQAFYHSESENSTSEMRWFIATNMKHGNARRVFPCFDEPRFKATFEISIARSMDTKALSTMPIRTTEIIAEQSGWEWDHFRTTPPMSTSSLTIFIFNPTNLFQVTPTATHGGVQIRGLAQAADLSKAQTMIDYFVLAINHMERYLGVVFPLPQLNVILLPDLSAHAEDYWGFFMVGNNFQSSVHLLRQWFGHLVTPEQWSHENFATSLAQYHAYICPLEVVESCESVESPTWRLRYSSTNQYDINDKPSPEQFQLRKMVWFFRMLNFTLTERSFRRGIQNFLKSRAYNTFTEEDLWTALDIQSWTYATLDRNISTAQVAKSWLENDHFPVVTVTRNYPNNTALIEQQVFVRRWPYAIPGQGDVLWWIPIMYLTQDNLDVHNISSISWMREEKYSYIENLPGPDSFIIVNPDDIGMFIVNYDPLNWKMLSEYLVASGSGDGQPLIPTATRAKLLHNAWYLALGGRVDFATALNMTLFLSSESELLVWKAMAQVYFTVSWKLIGTQAETKFDRFIGEMLIPLYESVVNETLDEYHPQAEVVAFARYVLCKAGYKEAVQRARVEYEQWLEEPKEIDGGLLWGVFRWVDADWESGLQRVLDLLHNDTAPGFRGFLLSQLVTSTIQPHKVERVLRMLLVEEEYIFPNAELKAVFAAITDSKTFLQFITKHWADIKKRLENKRELWQNLFEQATKKLKTQQGYDMVLEFYKTHKSKLGSAASIVQHSLQVIEANKEGTYKSLPALEAWLDNYLASSEANDLFFST